MRTSDLAVEDLKLWAGHECSVNRVGSSFLDQTIVGGHQDREDDLNLFSQLNVQGLRYPVLWERVSKPDGDDWDWSDRRLGRIGDLGLEPIVGLLHHGAGPLPGGLLDDNFALGLATHAAKAAARYPWVRDWNPVNEPLTTARFSALYGLWHPHARDETTFWTALLNQIDAIRLSMRAIRLVNPTARLIQTEDLGFTQAVASLRSQADYENGRRWLTWDLLFGAVTPAHPFWDRLAGCGLAERLKAIAADPCPPDVVGVNHYVTSERFLDSELDRYPSKTHGGNENLSYADTEAVRVSREGVLGVEELLGQAWRRYYQTLAVTESHLGCDVDEQIAWLLEGWTACRALRARGVPVEAFTIWSLLGAYDWDSLLTKNAGSYEPGVFDLNQGQPQWTALASVVRSLGGARSTPAPAARPGWWRRPDRLTYRPRMPANFRTPSHFPRPAL